MRAMVLNRYGHPLELEHRAERTPGPGEVLLEVEAAALCGSDVHAARGGYERPGGRFAGLAPPLVLGHQIAGRVVEQGRGHAVARSDRCLVYCYLYCGRCRRCLNGRQNVCQTVSERIGFEVEGGFAEYVTVPERNLFPAPAALDAVHASVLPDAVATSYHAVIRADVRPGERVAVLGVGALGLYAVRIAALRGAHVVAADRVDDERLAWARRFGAANALAFEAGISPEPAVLRRLKEGLGGEADAVLDFVGAGETLAAVPLIARRGARAVLVGVTAQGRIPLAGFAEKGIELRTSLASTPADLLDVIALADEGLVEPLVDERLALGELNVGLDRLARGEVVGRLVALPHGDA
jgi:alcohol dehydrogenase, propanol-preferring